MFKNTPLKIIIILTYLMWNTYLHGVMLSDNQEVIRITKGSICLSCMWAARPILLALSTIALTPYAVLPQITFVAN